MLYGHDAVHEVYIGIGDAAMRPFAGSLQGGPHVACRL